MLDLLPNLQNGVPEFSAAALFFIFFFGTFVSEDAACLLAGTAAANGQISFQSALTACFLGIFAGDVLLFCVGRAFGKPVANNRFVARFISISTFDKASAWLQKHGAFAVFLSRFVPGLRFPTYLLAGALRTNIVRFACYFLIASAIWTPILVGSTAFSQTFLFQKNTILGLIALAIIGHLAFKYFSRKDRRLLVGRIKRSWNWEFWPLPLFYAPVVLYVILLAFKHRSLTVFTAANPAISAGGFKGESKDEIYNGLGQSNAASEFMLSHKLIRADLSPVEKQLTASRWIRQAGIEFPVVLKPDAGERGKGVKFIWSSESLAAELELTDSDMIVQEFATGKEVSIFYYRYPNEERGGIFSITEKRFPVVAGDGRSSIEELILADPRAVCLAESYFEHNRKRLGEIPAIGENVELVQIGTHSLGAVFLDGEFLRTDALEDKIDEICRGFEGFYFGRFDIRTQSFDDLRRGKNFRLIELNGVTSESTNIYDPKFGIFDAYRILFEQWRTAFAIGSANCKLGKRPTPLRELVKLAFGYRVSEEIAA